jgi:hypothetical protein
VISLFLFFHYDVLGGRGGGGKGVTIAFVLSSWNSVGSKIKNYVTKHPLVHREGWMENDLETVFRWVLVPLLTIVVISGAFFNYLPSYNSLVKLSR